MFENIGGKIKVLAKVVFWIGVGSSILGGLAVLFVCFSTLEPVFMLMGVIYCALIIGLGALLSWIGVFFMYAFGQITENVETIGETSADIKELLQRLLAMQNRPRY